MISIRMIIILTISVIIICLVIITSLIISMPMLIIEAEIDPLFTYNVKLIIVNVQVRDMPKCYKVTTGYKMLIGSPI